VRAVNGGERARRIIELEQKALAESGNIIPSGCLVTIANILRRTLYSACGARETSSFPAT
jgi:chemotaxis protein CheC